MSRVIWHYKLSKQEQQLWEREELRGWREAMQGFVEDEAREQGYAKYAIYTRDNALIIKSLVTVPSQESDNNL